MLVHRDRRTLTDKLKNIVFNCVYFSKAPPPLELFLWLILEILCH